MGAIKAVGALAAAREQAHAANGLQVEDGIVDEWYVDDGVVICTPAKFEGWLRALDRALAEIGASRGRGQEAKSTVKLVGPPGCEAAFTGWDGPYVRDTCKVLEMNAANEYLGTMTGAPAGGAVGQEDGASLQGAMQQTENKRSVIASLDCPAAELTLLRRCADVSSLNYWLRCHGDRVKVETLEKHDRSLRASLETTLGGEIPDTAWWQATTGVASGGLGMRAAAESALPAFIGSRAACRPMVGSLLEHIERAGIGRKDQLLQAYDKRTEAAWREFTRRLPPDAAGEALGILQSCYADAQEVWTKTLAGGADEDDSTSEGHQRLGGTRGGGIVADVGVEDPEHPQGRKTGPKGQRQLQRLLDACAANGLRQHFNRAGSGVDRARLEDLERLDTDHSWMWSAGALGTAEAFEREEFNEAIRIRLGAGGTGEPTVCECCGDRVLDAAGAHASTCCTGEATVGHNLIKEVLRRYALLADPRTEIEPTNLVRSRPADRPADVLTTAAGRLSALDVGVTSTATASAPGEDAAEAMWRRKRREREPIRAELEEAGIQYVPVVWTHHGRPHAQAKAVVRGISRAVARRHGGGALAIERGIRCRIGTALARRVARMSLACMGRGDTMPGEEENGSGDPWKELPAIGGEPGRCQPCRSGTAPPPDRAADDPMGRGVGSGRW